MNREIYFKKLAYVIMEAANLKSAEWARWLETWGKANVAVQVRGCLLVECLLLSGLQILFH